MKFSKTKFVHAALFFSVALLSACGGGGGGGGGSAPVPPSTYSIGGTTSGLSGSVVLQNNLGDNLTVTANGAFTFATKINNGSAYSVSVITQPTGQTCSVSTGAGTASGSDVTNVAVVCATNAYNVGGTVSGLSGSVVLQDNNGDNLTVTANGAFTFATKVANGSAYSVTVLTQPTGKSCSVANGSGTIALNAVSNVSITCAANTYTVGGNISLMKGSMVLTNGTDNMGVAVNGAFTFPTAVAYGNPYNVSVSYPPYKQKCVVANGAGTVTGTVSDVSVTCASQMGGAIQGLGLNLVPTVSTVVGAVRGADGVGAAARFLRPSSVVSDGANLYVVDTGNNRIRKIVIATGVVSTLAGTGAYGAADGAGASASFDTPSSITTDGTNLYVADMYNNKIRKIVIATGEVSSLTGAANSAGIASAADGVAALATFNAPSAITMDGNNLYVADSGNHKIRKVVITTGDVSSLTGPANSASAPGSVDGAAAGASFGQPYGITSDGTNLYVADTYNHKIRKVVIASGDVSTLAGTGVNGAADGAGATATFFHPESITTDGTNLYVVEMNNNKIRVIDIASRTVGSFTGSANSTSVIGAADGARTSATFNIPQGITLVGGMLYVADTGNNTIRAVPLASTAVTTLAGNVAGSDGIGAAASFNQATSITSDGTNLYLADGFGNNIRKIVIATGAVSTLAGTGVAGAADGAGATATFDYPSAITTDGTNLYVAEMNNNKIRQIVIATGVVSSLTGTANTASAAGVADGAATGATFNNMQSITTDGTNLYVADANNNKIRQIVIATGVVSSLTGAANTAVIAGAADGVGASASFASPYGITTDGTNLYVFDMLNNKVRKIVISSGVVSSLTGTANTAATFGATDGPAASASFNTPFGITSDGANLYVADTNNNKIRKIVIATGDVSSLTGAANTTGVAGANDGAGATATFSGLGGITSDGTSLYVIDNGTIRKIQ